MEDTLWDHDKLVKFLEEKIVLILILMEDTLWAESKNASKKQVTKS